MLAQEELNFLSDYSDLMKSLYKYCSLLADEVVPRRFLRDRMRGRMAVEDMVWLILRSSCGPIISLLTSQLTKGPSELIEKVSETRAAFPGGSARHVWRLS